jgi:phosphoinositide-3-kinase regulatory subunit 4
MRVLQTLDSPRHLGPITALCVDRKKVWLVTGTGAGTLSLWDLRFGLLLRTWRVGGGSGGAQRVHQCSIHPTKGKGRWVVVAVDPPPGSASDESGTIVEVWDVEHARLVESFQSSTKPPVQLGRDSSRRSSSVSTMTPAVPTVVDDGDLSAAAAIEAFLNPPGPALPPAAAQPATGPGDTAGNDQDSVEALFATARRAVGPGVYSFVVGQDYGGTGDGYVSSANRSGSERDGKEATVVSGARRFSAKGQSGNNGGYLITGGEDRKLRFWDLDSIERSCIVSDPDLVEERPAYRLVVFPDLYWYPMTDLTLFLWLAT